MNKIKRENVEKNLIWDDKHQENKDLIDELFLENLKITDNSKKIFCN